ncbi:MAG TPA: PDZ domain-containing protein [Polyangiaceae bacterium]|jgi:hypothetical protein|nr:PDZ domain-containing protein [Polyangiaceae bacterium]
MTASWRPLIGALLLTGCGAVFPEVTPPVNAPPPGRPLVPPPPSDLAFMSFTSATIPDRTRDGRQWDAIGGSAPDPFAILFVNDKELLRTPVQSNTLQPTWPDKTAANYRLKAGARYRVELWDSNALNNRPICVKNVHDLLDEVGPAPVDIDCDSGAHIQMKVEPAHARWGLGFAYELKTGGAISVTRVLVESPAARAGIHSGDEIVEIQGKKVVTMDDGEPQSLINANRQVGVSLLLVGADKNEHAVSVKEGVIYPVVDEGVPIE